MIFMKMTGASYAGKANMKMQSGTTLVMALILLTVLTLIGVSSMSSSSLELKIASNSQQHNIAFQAAQSSLAFAASIDGANTNDFLLAITNLEDPTTWPVQTCGTGVTVDVGVLKGIATEASPLRSALLTVVTGGIASALAYGIGAFLRSWLDS